MRNICQLRTVGDGHEPKGGLASERQVLFDHRPELAVRLLGLRFDEQSTRLEACRNLGWTEVPAMVAVHLNDARLMLEAERDENTCRKDMVPSEKVALGLALEELEAPKAAERKAATQARTGEGKVGGGNLSPPTERGKLREIVGSAVGMSGATYQRAKLVVAVAERDDLSEADQKVAKLARQRAAELVKPAEELER